MSLNPPLPSVSLIFGVLFLSHTVRVRIQLFKEYVEVPPTDVDSFQFNNVRKDAHRALGKAKKVFDSYQRCVRPS